MATETIPHRDRRNPFFDTIKDRPRDRRNPFLDTIKDRPPRHSAETKITPPVKLEEMISDIWAHVKEDKQEIRWIHDLINGQTRETNKKLTKLEGSNMQTRGVESNLKRRIEILEKIVEGHQHSIKVLLEHNHTKENREQKKTHEREKKDRSAWSKMKRLLPYKDELEHKYIVD